MDKAFFIEFLMKTQIIAENIFTQRIKFIEESFGKNRLNDLQSSTQQLSLTFFKNFYEEVCATKSQDDLENPIENVSASKSVAKLYS